MDDSGDSIRSPSASMNLIEEDDEPAWTYTYDPEDAEGMDDDDEYDPDFQDEPEEEDGDDDDEFHDAEDGEDSNVEVEVFMGAGDEDDDDAEEDGMAANPISRLMTLITGAAGNGTGFLTRAQLLGLIQSGEVTLRTTHDEEDDDEDIGWGRRRRRPRAREPNRFPKVPSEEGTKLMHSGVFGANDYRVTKKKQLARRILDRELGLGDRRDRKQNQDLMAQGMIPSTNPEMIVHYDDPVYSGQFSDDGNFFYACGHDFKVRMYDTSNPYNWKYYKTVNYPWGQWTLTDASLSPDNRWLAYTSIQSNVCLAPTDPNDTGDPYTLDLAERSAGTRHAGWRSRHSFFGLSDFRERSSIVVYDIESRTVLHNVVGHEDDVNAVCFADKSSPHILYSGSDDATIKVWDRRSMGDGRPAGAFVGHVEGLTYIDSKGDGRYILSNGKDQTMKLWDLRMVMSTAKYDEDEDWFRTPTITRRPPELAATGAQIPYISRRRLPGWNTCVRDSFIFLRVSVYTSAWNGFNMAHGTCTLHSYNEAEDDEAEPPMGRNVDEKLRPVGESFQS
ncbi:WD repeat domain-containing protein [Colletotrichum scovillei]|uniref:WD repeat domain-containing protein n=1 Tax=Colletotrichum scovillei TaxID=1209932 RepID=UPI0015C3A36D|nr:WD repeat domain-containing protein [Colletotrichum scovillei]KAF4772802.1 WD repeat domain-containing protein [Colletotrichum scovillei]